MQAGGSGVRLFDGPDLMLFILVGWYRSFVVWCLVHRGSTGDLILLQIYSGVVWQSRHVQLFTQHVVSVESSSLLLHSIKPDLFVNLDD